MGEYEYSSKYNVSFVIIQNTYFISIIIMYIEEN